MHFFAIWSILCSTPNNMLRNTCSLISCTRSFNLSSAAGHLLECAPGQTVSWQSLRRWEQSRGGAAIIPLSSMEGEQWREVVLHCSYILLLVLICSTLSHFQRYRKPLWCVLCPAQHNWVLQDRRCCGCLSDGEGTTHTETRICANSGKPSPPHSTYCSPTIIVLMFMWWCSVHTWGAKEGGTRVDKGISLLVWLPYWLYTLIKVTIFCGY